MFIFDFTRYIDINRRGYTICLPKKVYDILTAKHIDISLVISKGKPSCVQLTSYTKGKQTYHGTLKKYMGVKGFKNGNVCDFRRKNIIMK